MFFIITRILVVLTVVSANLVQCTEVLMSNTRDTSIKISYPSQFIPSGRKFYFVGGVQNVKWAEAAAKCREVGAVLASVESNEEREALRSSLYNSANLWNMYWLAANGRGTCPYWRPVNGWYYENRECETRNYWICETDEPLNVAHRVWTGAI